MSAGADLSLPPTLALSRLPFGRWDSVGVVGRTGSAPSRVGDGAYLTISRLERVVELILAISVPQIMRTPRSCLCPRSRRTSWTVCRPSHWSASRVSQCPRSRRSTSWSVITNRPSLNQATKHVEIPQTQYIDHVVDVPGVMLRQIPQLQTVAKTVEVPPVPFVGRIVDVPAILQIKQVIKHVEIPQNRHFDESASARRSTRRPSMSRFR